MSQAIPVTVSTEGVPTPASSALDRWFVSLINDPRDLPFVHLIAGCMGVAALGVGLFFSGDYFWYLLPAYYLVWGLGFLDRFILMLHCTSHRKLFKKQHAALNQLIPWVVGPFFGETPDTYFAHHLGMHHPENNLPEDLSSTMRFQRDRLTHWLRYFLRFLLFGLIELSGYHHRKHNKKLLRRVVVGEVGFWGVVGALCWIDPRAGLMVFAVPVVAVRTLMMAGNWGQHAFVDAADPSNAYKNSITCINTRYNRRCFNDGYHIHHHVRATTHWSEMPAEFQDNQAKYGEEDAIVFEGIDFFQVWLLLMLGQHARLARRMVQLPGAPERSIDQRIEFMRSRLAAIPS